MEKASTIAILTDYGAQDPFVGILKGVVRGIAPAAALVDLTHEIPPGDVRAAAIFLWQARPYFPPGAVFLCVVDPGVGTARRGLLVQSGEQIFIGPDNGLFTFILDGQSQAWELANPDLRLQDPSATFHGRDIFAPAAAHAAQGVPGHAFGPPARDLHQLDLPALHIGAGLDIRGEILLADRFGNLVTSLGKFVQQGAGSFAFEPWIHATGERAASPLTVGPSATLQLPDGAILRFASTFAAIEPGEIGFLVGGAGLIEIAANRSSAERSLKLAPGQSILLKP